MLTRLFKPFLRRIGFFFCLNLSLVHALDTNQEIEKRSLIDQLELIRFEKNMEDRVSRDIRSYLDHDFYIIRVNAELENVESYQLKETIISPPQATPIEQTPSPAIPLEEKSIISQMELDTQDGISADIIENETNAETPLPGLPFFEQSSKKQQPKESKKTLQKRIETKTNQTQPPSITQTQNTLTEKEVTQELTGSRTEIRKLDIKVILDQSVTIEQEIFIRQLIIEKTNLSFIRGDILNLVRSEFPGAKDIKLPTATPEQKELPLDEQPIAPSEPFSWQNWLIDNWPYLLLASLLFFGIMLFFFRKKSPSNMNNNSTNINHETTDKIDSLIRNMTTKIDTISENRIQAIKEELVSLSATDHKSVNKLIKEWALTESEQDNEKLAALNYLLGHGLFSSLFRNTIPAQKIFVISAKAQEFSENVTPQEQLRLVELVYQSIVQAHYLSQQSEDKPQSKPFSFLQELDNDQLLYLINEEDIKVKAIVFSQLNSERAASLLKRISEPYRSRIAFEISQFDQLPINAFREIANRLAKKAIHSPSYANIAMNGIDLLIEMLDHMDAAEELTLLSSLKQDNPQLYYQIKQIYISFEDIAHIPTLALKNIIRETERNTLALAIFDEDETFKQKIFSSMLDQPRAMLQSILSGLQQPDSKQVNDAKRNMARRARAMLKSGLFVMPEAINEISENHHTSQISKSA